jgi:uncharacterized membrane protein YdjX (TVP38/TMEM64 family)
VCENPISPARSSRLAGVVNGGVFLAVIVLGAAIYLTPLKTWLAQGEIIKTQLSLFGLAAPLVFIAAAALLTAIGVPRLLLCSLGGIAFGFAWGLAWTQLGTVLGSYVTFLFVRWRGRDYVLNHFPRLRKFSQRLESRGLMAVILIRQLPLNGFYNNVFLGLTPVSHSDFLVGSFLGFLPLGVTACLLGAGLIQGDMVKGVQYIALGLACSVGLGIALNWLAQARKTSGKI